MARSKKSSINHLSLPSLFDDIDFGVDTPEPITLPGLDRHIRTVRAAVESRRAVSLPEASVVAESADRILFLSFGSGSSGNCTYIGTHTEGILIDAGVDLTFVSEELQRNGISATAPRGIILTHDHGDHVRYAYGLLRRYRHLGLYCTPRAFNGILRRHNVSRRIKDFHHPIYKEIPFKLGGFEITPFEVDHDGTDNCGFHITCPGFSFTIATDLGRIGDRADHYLRQADYIMIESNYDIDMLRRGVYPEYLKARIMASNGHLDNAVTAAYLASIYRPELKYIFLCHLSEENNTPQLARDSVANALSAIGVATGDGSNSPEALAAPLQLVPLKRRESSGLFTFRLPPR